MSGASGRPSAETGTTGNNARRDAANDDEEVDLISIQHPYFTRLPRDFEPGPYDVICARGSKAKAHEGNLRFRSSIDMHLKEYAEARNKPAKSKIVSRVVQHVYEMSNGGGFVKKLDGRWYEIGSHMAREKAGQYFRDSLFALYRSSSRAKKNRIRREILGIETPEPEVEDRRNHQNNPLADALIARASRGEEITKADITGHPVVLIERENIPAPSRALAGPPPMMAPEPQQNLTQGATMTPPFWGDRFHSGASVASDPLPYSWYGGHQYESPPAAVGGYSLPRRFSHPGDLYQWIAADIYAQPPGHRMSASWAPTMPSYLQPSRFYYAPAPAYPPPFVSYGGTQPQLNMPIVDPQGVQQQQSIPTGPPAAPHGFHQPPTGSFEPPNNL